MLGHCSAHFLLKSSQNSLATESIASGEYPVSRPLQFYIKHAHFDSVAGMREYIEFFLSDEIAGPDGPLAEYGLVSDPELHKTQEMISHFSH